MNEIDLADLDFDFEDYFDRHWRGELTEQEELEFDARVIGLFCKRMLSGKWETTPWTEHEGFAALYLAKKMRWVIGGVPWNKQFDLPFEWGRHDSDFSRVDQRAIDIFSTIRTALNLDPGLAVTDLIKGQADIHCVSFETARADYYRVKLAFDNGVGFRPFLKSRQ